MTAFDLTDSIHGIYKRLVAQLTERRHLPHPTIKGDEGELSWLKVLSDHLPRRYALRRGIVIDSRGERSDAIDLILYDPQYTPVFLAQDEHAYVLAEAVYAVFEVKYELDAGNIEYAAKKAESVRRLHRTNGPVYHAGGEIRQPKDPFKQLGGLLTLSHGWKGDFETKVREHVSKHDGNLDLDFVLCLQGGFLESHVLPPDQPPSTFESGDSTFVLFLYTLLHRLARLATVPAVVWPEYRERLRNASRVQLDPLPPAQLGPPRGEPKT